MGNFKLMPIDLGDKFRCALDGKIYEVVSICHGGSLGVKEVESGEQWATAEWSLYFDAGWMKRNGFPPIWKKVVDDDDGQ